MNNKIYGFRQPVMARKYTITVIDFRIHLMEELIPYSRSSLIFMDGITDEDDKYKYAESRIVCFLNVLYENNGFSSFSCYPEQWKIIDREAYIHKRALIDDSIMEELDLPVLLDCPVNPKRKIRAWIPFVLKQGRVPQYVSFFTGYFFAKRVDILIPGEYNKIIPLDSSLEI